MRRGITKLCAEGFACPSAETNRPDGRLPLVHKCGKDANEYFKDRRHGGIAFTLSMSVALAQQTLTGSITKIDEANGKITIQPAQGGTVGANTGSVAEDFRVQDGLIFNAVQPGDKVSFTVVDKDGVKTITELRKQ
jgi:Cu/Ag efflux protein CusF